jgi:predicted RNA-binding protein YlxR (DUF448 family)
MNAGRQTINGETAGAEDAPVDADCLDDGPAPKRRGEASDGGDGPDGPVRKCLATGARKPQAEMIRFVLGPDAEVVPDLAQRLPGRGMWLSADLGSIKTACARNLFAKAARSRARPPVDLDVRVERLLTRRCIDILSLARRAGEAVTGFEKVRAQIARGEAALLIEAADGAEDGRRKLISALSAARAAGGTGATPILSTLDAAEIGEAFGRERAVHAALAAGGLARKLAREMRRLDGLRADAGRETAGGRR